MEFNKETMEDLSNFFKTPVVKSKRVKIKLNQEYTGVIKEACITKNQAGDPVVSMYIAINVDNVLVDCKINKSFSESSRNNSRIYILQVLDVLGYKYEEVSEYIRQNSNHPLSALVNLYNSKKGTKIVYTKLGKPTSYKHIIQASKEAQNHEQ